VYRAGVLEPLEALPLEEGQQVTVNITDSPAIDELRRSGAPFAARQFSIGDSSSCAKRALPRRVLHIGYHYNGWSG